MNKNTNPKSLNYLYRTIGAAALIWTVIVVCSAAWNFYNERSQTVALAKKEAVSNFNKDQAFRLWATKHGGVYVPPTEQTPPNPYLSHIPDRDITMPSGKRLTLMNPAYMIRQMMADFGELYGIRGRITSLKPLNPANAPDAWELRALTAFEKGAKEFFEMTEHDGKQNLRLMRPMPVKGACLKCHSHQGYKEGDIRGGVGVDVPMEAYLLLEKDKTRTILLSHLVIWLFGSTLLGIVFLKGKRLALEQIKSEEALLESESYTSELIKNSPLPIAVTAKDGDTVLFLNKKFSGLFGYTMEDIPDISHWWPLACPEKHYRDRILAEWNARAEKAFKTMTSMEPMEAIVTCKDGSQRHIEFHMSSIGQRALTTFIDITERKQAEEALRKSAEMVERILSMTTTCIAYIDRDFNFIRVNKEYAGADGKSPDYFIGKNHFDLFPNQENEAIFRKVVETGEQHIAKAIPFEYKDNPERGVSYWDWSLTPVKDPNGKVETLILSLVNVTERTKAQEELGKLNEKLEARVAERTAELEEKNMELEKLNKLFVGRELRMIELKERIKELERQTEGPEK